MKGCEIVWPFPMGSGASSYASSARWGGRNHSRGSHAIVASTRPSRMPRAADRKSTRLNSSHLVISYAVFCLKKKKNAKSDTLDLPIAGREDHSTAQNHTRHRIS